MQAVPNPPCTVEAAVQATPDLPQRDHGPPPHHAQAAPDDPPQPQIDVTDRFCPDSQYLTSQTIPQLDGSALDTSTHECDNCHKKFTTEEQLKHHDETYQYGCEDCSICYQSTNLFDLHELAEHPNTHYALNIIPHSTKLQYDRSYK